MEEKNLNQLADEYARCIENTNIKIAEVLEALSSAHKQRRYMLVSKLNSNLATLYRQRTELIEIEKYLRSYYEDSEVDKAG